MNGQRMFTATLIVLTTLAAGYLLISNVRILVVLLVAIIIASALRPAVMTLNRFGLAHGLAITLVYLLAGLMIVGVLLLLLPPIVTQFAHYLENEGQLAGRMIIAQNWVKTQVLSLTGQTIELGDSETLRTGVSEIIAEIRSAIPSTAMSIGGALGEAVLVFVMGVYWLTSRDNAIAFLSRLFPAGERARFISIVSEIETTMGNYVRGVVAIAGFVSLANFIVLMVLGIPNAATYALIVGLATLLPVVGPFIGAITATLLALLSSPLHGLAVLLTFVGVQQLEMHIVTPRVMARSVGIDPLLVILAVFVGFATYGAMGAIIAVPLTGALAVLIQRAVIEPRQAEREYQVIDGGILLNTASAMPDDRVLKPAGDGHPDG
jgi:predicted PurR-regulated permease PerM